MAVAAPGVRGAGQLEGIQLGQTQQGSAVQVRQFVCAFFQLWRFVGRGGSISVFVCLLVRPNELARSWQPLSLSLLLNL